MKNLRSFWVFLLIGACLSFSAMANPAPGASPVVAPPVDAAGNNNQALGAPGDTAKPDKKKKKHKKRAKHKRQHDAMAGAPDNQNKMKKKKKRKKKINRNGGTGGVI